MASPSYLGNRPGMFSGKSGTRDAGMYPLVRAFLGPCILMDLLQVLHT